MKSMHTKQRHDKTSADCLSLDLQVQTFGFNLNRVHPPSYWRQSKNLFSLINILLSLVRSRAFYTTAIHMVEIQTLRSRSMTRCFPKDVPPVFCMCKKTITSCASRSNLKSSWRTSSYERPGCVIASGSGRPGNSAYVSARDSDTRSLGDNAHTCNNIKKGPLFTVTQNRYMESSEYI